MPPSVEDLTAVELPANTTPARAKVRGFQRLNRRTKIAMGAAAVVLAAVGGWGIWHNTVQNQPESRLFAMLPSGYSRDDCDRVAPIPPSLVTLVCNDKTTGIVGIRAHYDLYPDEATLAGDFLTFIRQPGFALEPCPSYLESPTTWQRDSTLGSLACIVDGGGDHTLVWSVRSGPMRGWIQDFDLNRPYQWWLTHH